MGRYVSDALNDVELVEKYVSVKESSFYDNLYDNLVTTEYDSLRMEILNDCIIVCKSFKNGQLNFSKVNKETLEIVGEYTTTVALVNGTFANSEDTNYSWCTDSSYVYLFHMINGGYNSAIQKISIATMSSVANASVITTGTINSRAYARGICLIGGTIYLASQLGTYYYMFKYNASTLVQGSMSGSITQGNPINFYEFNNKIIWFIANTAFVFSAETLVYENISYTSVYTYKNHRWVADGTYLYFINAGFLKRASYSSGSIELLCSVRTTSSFLELNAIGEIVIPDSGIFNIATKKMKYIPVVGGSVLDKLIPDKYSDRYVAYSLGFHEAFVQEASTSNVLVCYPSNLGQGMLYKYELKKFYA